MAEHKTDLETVTIRLHVERQSLNSHLGNTANATLRAGITEVLEQLFGTMESYCDSCGRAVSEVTNVRGHFEFIEPPFSNSDQGDHEDVQPPKVVWMDPTSTDADNIICGSICAPRDGGYLNCDIPYIPQANKAEIRAEALREAMQIYRSVASDEAKAEAIIAAQIAKEAEQ